jgi:hypothetical protein
MTRLKGGFTSRGPEGEEGPNDESGKNKEHVWSVADEQGDIQEGNGPEHGEHG